MRFWQRPLVAATATTVNAAQPATAPGVAQYNANQHPRGADGRFITTGGTVEVLQNGKPVAEGQVNAILTTPQGPMIQLKNPSTGQIVTVSPSQVQQAPTSIATLSAPGTQVIPPTASRATAAGRADARQGVTARTGTDPFGNKADPTLLAAYQAGYKAEQVTMARIAASKAKTAANKAAAANKKAGGSAYISPKSVAPAGFKHYGK